MGQSQALPRMERDDNYKAHKILDNQLCITNTDEFTCPICNELIPPRQGWIIRACCHGICKECIQDTIVHSKSPMICCPRPGCEGALEDREIRGAIGDAGYEDYTRMTLKLAEAAIPNAFHCCSPGCRGWVVIENRAKEFKCPLCAKKNCVPCGVIHRRESCQQYQEKKRQAEGPDSQLSAETKAKYLAHKMADDAPYACSMEAFECPICLIDVGPAEGVILRACCHSVCRSCLTNVVSHADRPQPRCPVEDCTGILEDREIRGIAGQKLYRRYMRMCSSVAENNIKNSYHCPSPDCPVWIVYTDNTRVYRCQRCGRESCIKCAIGHSGMTCETFKTCGNAGSADQSDENEEYKKRLIANGEAVKCPTCTEVIIKNGGCDGIKCLRCQTEICWATKGSRWGPKGKGDTSGGCRCRADSKRTPCHPLCRNCH